MNDRIRNLARQAGFVAARSGYTVEDFNVRSEAGEDIDETLHKFAKLVIEECCDIVNYRTQTNNPNDCLTVLEIKYHFGVEE